MYKKIFFILFVATLCLNTSDFVHAETFQYERLFYYREGPLARKSFFANPKSIDVFAPQTYSTDENGILTGEVKPDLLEFAKINNIQVVPLLTNGSFSQTMGHSLLDNKQSQDALITSLITEAQTYGYVGWQIDFEQMELSYRDKFSEFIERMYVKFKENNIQLSVAVIAQISENPEDYPKNLWQRIIGVYDYARLAKSTDFISIMSYDDPNSKGPVTGYQWLQKVIDHSLKYIPKEKLSLGLGLYYWQWRESDGKRIGIGGNEGIDLAIKKHWVTYKYSTIEQAPYMSYWSYAKKYTIWYENAKSIKQKISLIKKYQLRGFSAWALGLELPSVHTVIKQ